MSSYTLEQLATLEAAIAQGTTRVRYGDKEIEYRSLGEMLRTVDMIRKELGVTPSTCGRKFAEFRKGL